MLGSSDAAKKAKLEARFSSGKSEDAVWTVVSGDLRNPIAACDPLKGSKTTMTAQKIGLSKLTASYTAPAGKGKFESSSIAIDLVVVNYAAPKLVVMKADNTKLYRQPATNASGNIVDTRDKDAKPVYVRGQYDDFYLIDTGKAESTGKRWMFVEKGKVEEKKESTLEQLVNSLVLKTTKSVAEQKEFGETMRKIGALYEPTTGIPAIVFAGQSCLESGYGTSNIAINRNNIFGWKNNNNQNQTFESIQACIDRYNARVGLGTEQNPPYVFLNGKDTTYWVDHIGDAYLYQGGGNEYAYSDGGLWDVLILLGWAKDRGVLK